MCEHGSSSMRDGARILLAAAAYFAIVFAAGFVLGAIRQLLLVDRLGETKAVLIELPIMLGISWVVCRALVSGLRVPPTAGARLAMGAGALLLLLAAELALSVVLFGRTPAQHLATYAHTPAQLGLAAQVAFAAFPLALLRGPIADG